jgi:hypothetical protein
LARLDSEGLNTRPQLASNVRGGGFLEASRNLWRSCRPVPRSRKIIPCWKSRRAPPSLETRGAARGMDPGGGGGGGGGARDGCTSASTGARRARALGVAESVRPRSERVGESKSHRVGKPPSRTESESPQVAPSREAPKSHRVGKPPSRAESESPVGPRSIGEHTLGETTRPRSERAPWPPPAPI